MNVFTYSQTTELNWKRNLENMCVFKPKYTFYSDFGIAEFCEVYMRDKNAVKKTYNNVIKSWCGDYKALTEFIMVLNHKSWSFAQNIDSSYLKCGKSWKDYYWNLYCELYHKAVDYFFKKYEDNKEATHYYYEVTD